MAAQSLAFIIGGILGFIIGPLFVSTKDPSLGQINNFLLVQTGAILAFGLPAIFLFREKPEFPPSLLKIEKMEHSPWQEFKKLVKIKNFVLLSINFAFMTTVYDLIALLIDPLTTGVGYTGIEKSILAVIFCVFGMFGLIVIKVMLDKYNAYLAALRFFAWGGFAIITVAFFTLTEVFWPFCVTICFAGFFVIPDTAVCLAFAGDATYPAEQTMVNGIISLLGHGMAGILAVPASAIALKSPKWAVVFLAGLTLLGALPTLFTTEDLRRTKFEKKQREEEEGQGLEDPMLE